MLFAETLVNLPSQDRMFFFFFGSDFIWSVTVVSWRMPLLDLKQNCQKSFSRQSECLNTPLVCKTTLFRLQTSQAFFTVLSKPTKVTFQQNVSTNTGISDLTSCVERERPSNTKPERMKRTKTGLYTMVSTVRSTRITLPSSDRELRLDTMPVFYIK